MQITSLFNAVPFWDRASIHIDGKQVFLKSPVPFAMDATETRVLEIDMLRNVNLSDFTVTNNLVLANLYNFINCLPAYDSKSAIQYTGTSGSSL
jgi:hypothetical protein